MAKSCRDEERPEGSHAHFGRADKRFYASSYGRFNTPDPAARRAAKVKDPGSWNRYAYSRGDPVNRRDRSGLDDGGADDGCIELDDRTYDCGTLITDDSWGWGDPLGGEEDSDACASEPEECVAYEVSNGPGTASQTVASIGLGYLQYFGQLNSYLHAESSTAIADLSAPCQTWLTSAGINLNSLLASAQSEVYFDTTNSWQGSFKVGQLLPGAPFAGQTLAQYLPGDSRAASLVGAAGVISNYVALGAGFFSGQGGFGSSVLNSQWITLVHEALHYNTDLADIPLATQLGLWQPGMDLDAASNLISTRLADCFK